MKMSQKDPAYQREDYAIAPVGDVVTDLNSLAETGVLYQMDCPKCKAIVRTQGVNVMGVLDRAQTRGCPVCGEKCRFTVRRTQLKSAQSREAEHV